MKKRVISWVEVVFLICGAGTCEAQRRVSLREAVDQALLSRASLNAEQERISTAEGLRKQAGLRPNPEFQFQEENLRPGQTYTRDVDTLALISQPLDLLGKRKERMAVADQGVIRTQAEYELARWQVVRDVKLAYWAARGAQEIHAALKATVDNFQKNVDYHSAQLSAGAIAEQDFLRVSLEGERLKISADLANIDASRARATLFRAMGAALCIPLVFRWSVSGRDWTEKSPGSRMLCYRFLQLRPEKMSQPQSASGGRNLLHEQPVCSQNRI
jgi:cobalt-zinc-cadmium efflux system outer membrane protein